MHRRGPAFCAIVAGWVVGCGRLADGADGEDPSVPTLTASVTQADSGAPQEPSDVPADVSLTLFWRASSSFAEIFDASSPASADSTPLQCVPHDHVAPSCSGIASAGAQECTFRRAPEIAQAVAHRVRGRAFEVPLRDDPPFSALYDLAAQGGSGWFGLAALRAFVDRDRDGVLRYGARGAAPEPVVADSAFRDRGTPGEQRRSYRVAFLRGRFALDRVRPELTEVLRSVPQGFSVWIDDEWIDAYGRPSVFGRRVAAVEEGLELATSPAIELARSWCDEFVEDMQYVPAIPVGHAPLWCSEDGKQARWSSSVWTAPCTYQTWVYEGDYSCAAGVPAWSCPVAIDGLVQVSVATISSDPVVSYTVSIDGKAPTSVGAAGGVTLGTSAGTHAVSLGGIPANCSVQPGSPLTVNVTRGGVTPVHFEVQCVGTTRLRITTMTTGQSLDDGYLVTGSGFSSTIGANDSILLDFGPSMQGWLDVNVGNVAWNCSAGGALGESRDVSVWLTRGQITEVLVPVQCTGAGRIRVTTTARRGALPASDGFVVKLTALDAPWQPGSWEYFVPTVGTFTIGDGSSPVERLPAGTYRARLAAFGTDCDASPGEVTLEVVAEATADVEFDLGCRGAAALRITTMTTGASLDDRYVVTAKSWWPSLEQTSTVTVAANDTLQLELVYPGRIFVYFADVAWNCTPPPSVSGPGSPPPVAEVTLGGGEVDQLTIPVQCTAGGRVRVTTTVSGDAPDIDGFGIVLSGGDVLHVGPWEYPVPATGTVLVGDGTPAETLPAGTYEAHLSGVARNCDVVPATVTFQIVADQTADLAFDVQCSTPGRVRVTTSTSGTDPDPDGYEFVLTRTDAAGPADSIPIATNGTGIIDGLHAGTYRGRLTYLAPNCSATEPTFEVVWGETSDVLIEVTCVRDTQIAFTGRGWELWDYGWRLLPGDIYVVNSNGTGSTNLTQHPADDIEPAWSPDGRIVFTSNRDGAYDVYVMNADGSFVTRLTTGGAYQAAWSPEGARIAFVSDRDGNPEIYVMNADGTEAVRVTDDAAGGPASGPVWSPDGQRIAFARGEGFVSSGRPRRLYFMNADGSGVSRVRSEEVPQDQWPFYDESEPDWSPDGSRIAFTRGSQFGPMVEVLVLADQTATPIPVFANEPSWSSDGRHIAYTVWSGDCGEYGCDPAWGNVYVRTAGGSVLPLTAEPFAQEHPAWRR